MKPVIKYRGGKQREIKFFESFIPEDFDTYLEPFLGGGAVYFHLEPEKAIINDVNKKLVDFYCSVKNDYETLRVELDELQSKYEYNRALYDIEKSKNPNEKIHDRNEELYYQLRDMYNNLSPKKYSDATLYYFINKTSYSGMIRYNKKGEFNVPYGRYKNFNTKLLTLEHHQLLQNTNVYNNDYSAIFNMAKENDFIFLDPPYDTVFSDYGNIEFTGDFKEQEQVQLSEDFRNLNCKAMMIIGSTPLIESLYAPYIQCRYEKKYSVNIKNRFNAKSEHLIITNY